jgi:hypothetical protein
MTTSELCHFLDQFERNLKTRKAARPARIRSAEQGVSAYWAKAGENCRRMFP